ncbi:MAG: DinB family protein [Fimbriimonas sp.]
MKRHDIAPLAGYSPAIGLLAAALQDGTQEWLRQLGEVDEDALTWQPFEGGHSIGALILHIADVEAWWIETVLAGRELSEAEVRRHLSEETDQYAVRWPVPPRMPLTEYLAILSSVRTRTLETLKAVGDPAETRARGQSEFTLRWIVNHVVQHESYHGGQAVLIQLMAERRAISE